MFPGEFKCRLIIEEGFLIMIAKKRITLSRTAKLLTVIFVILLVFLILDQEFSLHYTVSKSEFPIVKFLRKHYFRELSHMRSDPLYQELPCKLYRLLPKEKQRSSVTTVTPVCTRVEPVRGSCTIAEKLFHSDPPAKCDHQKTFEFCKITKSASTYDVSCKSNYRCPHLSAGIVDVKTGRVQWKEFQSTTLLEKWISLILQPSAQKVHFGFCYIACKNESKDPEEEGIYPDEFLLDEDNYLFDTIQILILPPSFLPALVDLNQGSQSVSSINFNVIFIDSVSRQHFFRSLPQTVRLFQELAANETQKTLVLDFELFQAVRSRTFETLQTLFAGEIDPLEKPFGVLEMPSETLKTEHLLKILKERGYTTLWLEDLCYKWEWGLSKDLRVHNKSLNREEIWQNLQTALQKASIDSLEITYAMCRILSENKVPDPFHGPDSICQNGKHQHEYLLEYLLHYQEAMLVARKPWFTFLETNVGHEDTGRRIQTIDIFLSRYLAHAARFQNTLTLIMSDHGNSYGEFLEKTTEGRMELFHPHLFMIIPNEVASVLGPHSVDALLTNQQQLISHLDLHYMLQALANNFKNAINPDHSAYNVTSRGLLDAVSSHRTCSHIPRIMPNLCICKNFDMPVDSDAYHALFAHQALGKINNEIQLQFQRTLPKGVARGFGYCQQLYLLSFKNVRKSFLENNTVSLKMDLLVLGKESFLQDENINDYEQEAEIFFVSMHAHLGTDGGFILEKLDRITPYSKFSVCADTGVDLQLCMCDTNSKKLDKLPSLIPRLEDVMSKRLLLNTKFVLVENSNNCLYLIQRSNEHGGVFFVANLCQDRGFYIQFMLKSEAMYQSEVDLPIKDTVLPGQEIFLCMAIKNAPKAAWSWSLTLNHKILR